MEIHIANYVKGFIVNTMQEHSLCILSKIQYFIKIIKIHKWFSILTYTHTFSTMCVGKDHLLGVGFSNLYRWGIFRGIPKISSLFFFKCIFFSERQSTSEMVQGNIYIFL